MKIDEKEAKKAYNNLAMEYHNLRTKTKGGWFYNELLEMPSTLKILGNVKGKKILDFGCGTGIYAKKLTQKGAIVYGFDISEKMLNIAKKYSTKTKFILGSGYKIPFKEKFDVILASLVFDHFKDLNKVFKNINKHLKKDGVFVFSIPNPVAECTRKVIYKGKKFRILDGYFKEDKSYASWGKYPLDKNKKEKLIVPQYHRTYETIIKTIAKNGFEIIGYKDCFPIQKAKKLYPEGYKFFSNTPYFCVWKVKKK